MKIVVITLVYNEAERLPFFLRHYSLFVDEIVVYYNVATTDNSYNLLKDNKLVKIIDYNTGGVFNEQMNKEVKNTSWKDRNADWFIVCDADEFLYYKNMKEIRELLWKYLDENVTIPMLRGYQMVGDPLPVDDGHSQIYDHCKYGAEYEKYLDVATQGSHKQIIFHPNSQIEFNEGAHSFLTTGKKKFSSESVLKYLHYRYFDFDYVWKFYRNLNADPKDKHTSFWTKDKTTIKRNYNWFYDRRKLVIE